MENLIAKKPITCKAAICFGVGQPLVVDTVEVAPPKSWEVRIKMVATGVCRSDYFYMTGGDPNLKFPIVFGHEGAGIVESIGIDVTSVQPGDHVVPLFVPQCNKCKWCMHKNTNLCKKFTKYHKKHVMYDETSRITYKGQPVYQFDSVSTFSEYTVVAEAALVKVNPKAPLDKMCLLGCCVSTGYGSVVSVADVEPGSSCAVWGLGGVGMAVVMGCHMRGASRIIGIDVNPEKFKLAKKFGCTECLNPNDYDEPIELVLQKMTDGGLDYTFVATSAISAINSGLKAAHRCWGKAIMIGIGDLKQPLSANVLDLLWGTEWKGCLFGGLKGKDDIPILADMYLKKDLEIDEFVTNTLPLEKINEAFDMLNKPSINLIRTIIIFRNTRT